MKPNPIPAEELLRMYRDGMNTHQISKKLGVTWQSVNDRKKRIEAKLARVPDTIKNEISRENIDTVQQLRKMNDSILTEMDRCRRLIDREDAFIREKETLEKKVKRNPTDTELVKKLQGMGYTNLNDILNIQKNIIAISGEVRKQIELQVKIYETIYNIQLVAEFQEEILDILKQVDPDIRKDVVRKLKERRSMRGLVRLSQ